MATFMEFTEEQTDVLRKAGWIYGPDAGYPDYNLFVRDCCNGTASYSLRRIGNNCYSVAFVRKGLAEYSNEYRWAQLMERFPFER